MDGLGRLVKVFEDPAGSPFETDYTYDPLGNLIHVAQGQQHRYFKYDSLSRLIRARNVEQGVNTPGLDLTDPATGNNQWSMGYDYDNASNLLTRTNPNSTTVGFSYDGLNRVKSKTLSSGGVWDYTYDTAAISNAKGRLVSVALHGATDGYYYDGYDATGRVTASRQVTTAGSANTYTMSYAYNLAGEMTSQIYPSGKEYRTSYDDAGRVSDVRRYNSDVFDKRYASQFSYSPHGAVSAMLFGNGKFEHTIFNRRLQPMEIGLGANGTASDLLKLEYTYGTTANNGNLLTQKITAPMTQGGGNLVLTQTYTYDAINRLQTASENGSPGWIQTYDCDRYGNRAVRAGSYIPMPNIGLTPQSANSTDFTAFNQNTNRIALGGFGYDTSGNLTGDPTTGANTIIYDAENRQTSYSKAGATTNYSYDGDGRRVKKAVGSLTTVFVYNVSGQLIAEYTSDPVPPAQGGGGTSYLTSDHLGSTRVVTNSTGLVIKARYDYLPFGEEIDSTIGSRSLVTGYGGSDSTRQKFTQKERDTESGLDYFLARYYSSAQGRFTSPDEFQGGPNEFWVLGSGDSKKQALLYADVTNPQSLNKYQYCYNNPLRYVDSNGKWPSIIHQQILESAFPGLSPSQIRILARASERVDWDQSEKGSYKHAMRAPNQSIDDAKKETANFIAQNEDEAKQFQREHEQLGRKGLSNDALDAAGQAFHTVTDATSPAHTDKQGNPEVWSMSGSTGKLVGNMVRHALKERKISPEQMKEAVNAARQEFGRIFGIEVLRKATTARKPETK